MWLLALAVTTVGVMSLAFIQTVEYVSGRPGHDLRYSLDCKRIHRLGWKSKVLFEEGLQKTIAWYASNKWWWRPVVS